MSQKRVLWNPKCFTKQKCSTLYIHSKLRMNQNKVEYGQQKKSRFVVVLWVLAILAIILVSALYIWGKTIHDSLPA